MGGYNIPKGILHKNINIFVADSLIEVSNNQDHGRDPYPGKIDIRDTYSTNPCSISKKPKVETSGKINAKDEKHAREILKRSYEAMNHLDSRAVCGLNKVILHSPESFLEECKKDEEKPNNCLITEGFYDNTTFEIHLKVFPHEKDHYAYLVSLHEYTHHLENLGIWGDFFHKFIATLIPVQETGEVGKEFISAYAKDGSLEFTAELMAHAIADPIGSLIKSYPPHTKGEPATLIQQHLTSIYADFPHLNPNVPIVQASIQLGKIEKISGENTPEYYSKNFDDSQKLFYQEEVNGKTSITLNDSFNDWSIELPKNIEVLEIIKGENNTEEQQWTLILHRKECWS